MKKNRGYTLIEMIIVIAIMAIMAGVSIVSIGIIRKAKCNAAIDTFNNQLASLWIKTKAISQAKEQSSGTLDAELYPLCMQIQENTDSSDDIKDGSYVLTLGYNNAGTFKKREQITVLPSVIDIYYKPSGSASPAAKLTEGIIQFNKSDGSVTTGAGLYEFHYAGSRYGNVVLNKVTGNHYAE